MKAGNQTLLKKNNQRAITEYIIKNGPISRADLSKKLKISKPTVSANMTDLISMNLLQEIGFSSTEIGKKPMLVDFNRDYKYVLAMDFISYYTKNQISVAVCNLYCEPIFIDTITLPPDFTGNTIKHDMPSMLFKMFEKYNVPTDKIARLVLTAATVWYDDSHVAYECRNGEKVNLAEIFKPYFKNKISVKNDINLAALGEKYFGVGKDSDNLLFAWVGFAIGGGVILNGELYEGKDLSGGEFAYSLVYNNALERTEFYRDIVDREGIKRYIAKKRDKAEKSSIATLLLEDKFALNDIISAALNGDEFCVDFAKHIADISARLILNFAHTMNLQMVIVGGEYSHLDDLFFASFDEALKGVPLAQVKITKPQYTNSAMYGAFKFGAESILAKLI